MPYPRSFPLSPSTHRSDHRRHHQSHTATDTCSASDFLQRLPLPLPLSSGPHRLVHNYVHEALEARLARIFRSSAALLFNSDLNANAGFAYVPSLGDSLLPGEVVHVSLHHDGRVATRMRHSFAHNDVFVLRAALRDDSAAPRREEGTCRCQERA